MSLEEAMEALNNLTGLDVIKQRVQEYVNRMKVLQMRRAAGLPEVGTVAEFFDVVFGSYYADAVSWAAENGITGGTTETTFSPANSCTRAQIVTFLYRMYAK